MNFIDSFLNRFFKKKPKWKFVCSGDADYGIGGTLLVNHVKLPKWLRRRKFPYDADVIYFVNGKRFVYKIIMTRPGEQGSPFEYAIYKKKRIKKIRLS